MKKTNKKCCLCGTEYYYCSHCPSKSPSYMLHSCSENCKEITTIVSCYAAGDMDVKTAARKLRKCDLTRLETFKKGAKATIKKILEAAPVEQTKVVANTAKPAAVTAPVKPAPVAETAQTVKKAETEKK